MADLNTDFCKRLVDNLTEYCGKTYGYEKYPNQDHVSCQSIVDACLEVKPDYALDIGTNFGASTLSLAFGLKSLGRDLSVLTAIDYSLKHWQTETKVVQKELLEKNKINVGAIREVCADFQTLDPKDFIKDGKALVFYDIHDTLKHSFMTDFIERWLPLFSSGSRIMVHDFSAVPDDFVSPYKPDLKNPRSRAKHFNGTMFEGFMEVEVLIKNLNKTGLQVYSVPNTSVIGFDL